MGTRPTAEQWAAARAAAARFADQSDDYGAMCRGTLDALDWLEGRRTTGPITGTTARPDDEAGPFLTAASVESGRAMRIGEVPGPEQHYAGAVWAALGWAEDVDHPAGLSINV